MLRKKINSLFRKRDTFLNRSIQPNERKSTLNNDSDIAKVISHNQANDQQYKAINNVKKVQVSDYINSKIIVMKMKIY